MKKIIAIAATALTTLAFSATYELDTAHTNVGFEVSHLGITKVPGKFKDFKGSFDFDEKTNTISNINIEVKTASVDTGNTDRDKHLAGPDFFDAGTKGNETATFVFPKATKLSPSGTVTGELTLRGTKQSIPLKIVYKGSAEFMGTNKASFDATTNIDRTKFGMTWNKDIDVKKPGLMSKMVGNVKEKAVGTVVALSINVEANQKKAEAAEAPKKK